MTNENFIKKQTSELLPHFTKQQVQDFVHLVAMCQSLLLHEYFSLNDICWGILDKWSFKVFSITIFSLIECFNSFIIHL